MLQNEPNDQREIDPAVWFGEDAEVENGYEDAEGATDWMERQAELDLINSE